MHLYLSLLTTICPHAFDVWRTHMPAYFLPHKRHTGRRRSVLIQELKRFTRVLRSYEILRLHEPDGRAHLVLSFILSHRRGRQIARIHNGLRRLPYIDQFRPSCTDPVALSEIRCNIMDSVPPITTLQAYLPYYRDWRHCCLFTGSRARLGWELILPQHEDELTEMFGTSEYRTECREAWLANVALYARIKRESRESWNAQKRFGRKSDVKRVWQEMGGHIHRMPSCHKSYLSNNVDNKSMIRFFVLLMKNKHYRYHDDRHEHLVDGEYQLGTDVATMSLDGLVRRFSEEFLQSVSEYR